VFLPKLYGFPAADFLPFAIIHFSDIALSPHFQFGDTGKPGRTQCRRCCGLKKGIFLRKPVMPNFAIYVSERELSDTRRRFCRDRFLPTSRTSLCFAILHHLWGCSHFLLLSSQSQSPDGGGRGIKAFLCLVISGAFIARA